MIADIINLLIYVIVGFILINIVSVMGVMVYYKLKKLIYLLAYYPPVSSSNLFCNSSTVYSKVSTTPCK